MTARVPLALLILVATPAAAETPPTPQALCAHIRAVAKAQPGGPEPLSDAFCQKMLAGQREALGPKGWAGFAACVQQAQQPAALGACNPSRFAGEKPPPTLPAVPAGAPFGRQVVVLMERVVALAEHHRPACAALGVALDAEQAAHGALLKQLTAFRSLPQAERAARLKAVEKETVALVAALVPLAGLCEHPLLTALVGSL